MATQPHCTTWLLPLSPRLLRRSCTHPIRLHTPPGCCPSAPTCCGWAGLAGGVQVATCQLHLLSEQAVKKGMEVGKAIGQRPQQNKQ